MAAIETPVQRGGRVGRADTGDGEGGRVVIGMAQQLELHWTGYNRTSYKGNILY